MNATESRTIEFLTVAEACALLRCSRTKIEAMIARGLPVVTPGHDGRGKGRRMLFEKSALMAFVMGKAAPAPAKSSTPRRARRAVPLGDHGGAKRTERGWEI